MQLNCTSSLCVLRGDWHPHTALQTPTCFNNLTTSTGIYSIQTTQTLKGQRMWEYLFSYSQKIIRSSLKCQLLWAISVSKTTSKSTTISASKTVSISTTISVSKNCINIYDNQSLRTGHVGRRVPTWSRLPHTAMVFCCVTQTVIIIAVNPITDARS